MKGVLFLLVGLDDVAEGDVLVAVAGFRIALIRRTVDFRRTGVMLFSDISVKNSESVRK